MATIITSQDYRDQEIIATKREAQDYTVTLSPEFDVDGETYQVIIDGHHSFEAARLDGAEPEYIIATKSIHDAISLLDKGEIDDFLIAIHLGDDYRDAFTGKFIW